MKAMEQADEQLVKKQLKNYINEQGYNPLQIDDYIDSVNWL